MHSGDDASTPPLSSLAPPGVGAVAGVAVVAGRGHAAQLYETDAFLAATVVQFFAPALTRGDAAVMIATKPHRDAVEERLEAAGVDLAAARREGRWVALDASETLSRFMAGDLPDSARFTEVVGGVVAAAAHGGRPVRAFGEMVALLWADGRRDAAIRLEALWNELARLVQFSLLCAYPVAGFATSGDARRFAAVCDAHTAVFPAESYPTLGPRDERLRVIAALQQRAAALEHEIAAREAAEAALRRQYDEMDEFFENAAIPIHSMGPDGVIQRANRAELELLGYAPEEFIGRNIADFHVDPSVLDELLQRLARGETVRGYEARLRRRDGSIKHVAIDSNVLLRDGKFVHARCFTRDVTLTRRAEEAHARLAAIVESSDDAIVGKTLDGVVTSWNRGAERLFGYTADEMIGRSMGLLIPPERPDDLSRIVGSIQRGERVDHYETERIRKDGRRIQVSLTVSPIRDERGRVIGASKIARDVTERKAAEAERERLLALTEQARAEAEAASRAKDDFLSVVSHELRTPLASMLGWVAVLKTGVDGERAARALDTIERSGRAQAKIIEDLLDVSRVVGGRLRLDLRLVDLPPLVRSALDTVRPAADAKGVRLEASLDPAAGPVAGDVDRLQQIAWNLLSNAVKFTPAGGLVEVRLERREEDVGLVVRDSGRGIAPDFLPFVFDRFRQGEEAATRRTSGLGLGLAIVRHLVELHGGEVAVESGGSGRGATFTVTLPLTPLRGDRGDELTEAPLLLEGLHVLLVDDEPDARESFRTILHAHGARVTAADSVQAAREALRAGAPDVIVSDLCLPGEDGYALARELAASDAFRRVPAIAVTGYDGEGDGRALAAGYRVRLRKPVDPELLITAIARLTTARKAY